MSKSAAPALLVPILLLAGFGLARVAVGTASPGQCAPGAAKHARCTPADTTTTSPTSAGTTTSTTTTSATSPTTTTTTSTTSPTTTTTAATTTTTATTTTAATTTASAAPSPGWTTPACDLTLTPGAELGGPLNNTANQGKTICLPDGGYWLTQTQHVPGIKVYALHQYQAKIVGWIETYAAGDEWHGVSIDNGGYQGLQVYADNFVFVDSSFTNSHNAGGFYLGSSTYGVAHNVLIARNKIFNVGRLPGGTGGDHPFYAADASGYITDNWLWGNIGFGIQFYPHAFGLSFSYNVVVGQQQADVIFASDGTNDVASHNVFVSNATGFTSYQQSGTGAAADHSWFWNVGSAYSGGGYAQGGGDGSGDPQFVDAANKNYNLQTGSPAASYGPRVTLP